MYMNNSKVDNLLSMLKIAWQQNRFFIIYQLCSNTIRGPFPLLIAYINKVIIDKITVKYSDGTGFIYLVILVLLTVLIQIFYEYLMTLDTKLSYVSSNNIFVKIQDLILNKLKTLDKAHFDRVYSKDIVYRGRNFDYKSIHDLINLISNIFRRFFTAIIAAIVLVKYNYLLTILIAVIYGAKIIVGRKSVIDNKKMNILLTELNRQKEYYSEVLKSKKYLKELRIYDSNKLFENKFSAVSDNIYKVKKQYISKNIIISGTLDLVQVIINGLLYGILVVSAYVAKISIGDINFIKSAFDNLNSELYSSISMIIDLYKDITTFDFFNQFMNLENSIISNKNGNLKVVKNKEGHKIEFKNVYFSYPNKNVNVFENVSFTIEKGESVGLIGVNGSGKTTIIKLLLRVYDCDKGEILIDGINIKKYEPYQYYSIWGVQYQEYNLYPISILQNITLGVEENCINMELINKAMLFSDSCKIISKFGLDLNTEIYKVFDSNGYEPSGGEAQRLALARLFYKEAEMFILDEPSASIDANAENMIFNSLESVIQGRTSVFISHRLSNVRFCNKIILLENGKIIAEGSHESLMNNKYYSNLYTLQRNSYIVENEVYDKYEYKA